MKTNIVNSLTDIYHGSKIKLYRYKHKNGGVNYAITQFTKKFIKSNGWGEETEIIGTISHFDGGSIDYEGDYTYMTVNLPESEKEVRVDMDYNKSYVKMVKELYIEPDEEFEIIEE
jgi:hypothetical protein